MYSDSPNVLDALAEVIEMVAWEATNGLTSDDQMEQVRCILGVDKESIGAHFDRNQPSASNAHEMAPIVQDLVSAVGLQRFRFTERQNAGKMGIIHGSEVRETANQLCFR